MDCDNLNREQYSFSHVAYQVLRSIHLVHAFHLGAASRSRDSASFPQFLEQYSRAAAVLAPLSSGHEFEHLDGLGRVHRRPAGLEELGDHPDKAVVRLGTGRVRGSLRAPDPDHGRFFAFERSIVNADAAVFPFAGGNVGTPVDLPRDAHAPGAHDRIEGLDAVDAIEEQVGVVFQFVERGTALNLGDFTDSRICPQAGYIRVKPRRGGTEKGRARLLRQAHDFAHRRGWPPAACR